MKTKEVLEFAHPSKRKRSNVVYSAREERDIVPVEACHLGKLLARQQAQGVEQCTSRTIPVQHDAEFGDPGVLGQVCQDGHLLLQQIIDSGSSPSSATSEVKPS